MQTLSEIRRLLEEKGIRPKHRLGQNFLHDHNQLRKLVERAGVRQGSLILEIGPGTGTLTETLLAVGAEVIACELDAEMADIVQERFASEKRLTLIEGDCLEDERRLNAKVVAAIGQREFKLVANLPYQAASPLIATLVMHHPQCAGQWVTIQKEVADRIAAKPGSKVYGTLSVLMQTMGDVDVFATVKPASFWPIPKVMSAMVQILPKAREVEDTEGYAKFVTKIFSKRRKQMGTILTAERAQKIGIDPKLRPESLEPEIFAKLWRSEDAKIRS